MIFVDPLSAIPIRATETPDQGSAADPDRAGALLRLSRRGLEHRRRGPVRDRRASPVRGGASPSGARRALWLLPLMAVAGAVGGLAWAMIPAILKIRFNANEILVSLMLVYVAGCCCRRWSRAPARPAGLQLPAEPELPRQRAAAAAVEGTRRACSACAVALLAVLAAQVGCWCRHLFGFNVRLLGEAPRAADFAGVNARG
jgi:ABC-type uncharacterized transport system permease subunit